jgi:hypothetical protein
MNPQKKATIHQQSLEQQQADQQLAPTGSRDFASVEELLRHDAIHTPLPPAIAERLSDSVGQLPTPRPRSWWRRIFGGSSL